MQKMTSFKMTSLASLALVAALAACEAKPQKAGGPDAAPPEPAVDSEPAATGAVEPVASESATSTASPTDNAGTTKSGTTKAGAKPTGGPAGEVPAGSRKPTKIMRLEKAPQKPDDVAAPDTAGTETAAEEPTADAPTAEPAKSGRPDAISEADWDEHWSRYWKNIDFVFGSKAGLAAAAKSGKPMMIFYTATW